MNHSPYHPDLAAIPFMLGRHGESIRNTSEMAQGLGDEIPGLHRNGLTELGIEQSEAIYPALAAAGLAVTYVNSSRLARAVDTATTFVKSHPDPKPPLGEYPVPNLEEVSQFGWETIHTRAKVKVLRQAALAKETSKLQAAGLAPTLEGHTAWIAQLGKGESPLAAALRGITALEEYGVKPGELIFSHGMLNRYMDAVATRVPRTERVGLLRSLQVGSAAGSLAVLQALEGLGLPAFTLADAKCNQQANGGITEYTIDHDTGLWIAGRRIEPSKSSDTVSFVEHRRGADGMWYKITSSSASEARNNE